MDWKIKNKQQSFNVTTTTTAILNRKSPSHKHSTQQILTKH